jgi:hypothetical protein
MVATGNQPISKLDIALATFEDALESPVVPGELTEWCSRAQKAFETVRDRYVHEARPSHARQLAEIHDQDQEMGTIVAQLADEDKAIVVELERLGSLLQVFIERVDPKAEGSDEPLLDEEESSSEGDRRSLVQELLALVIRVRTHEKSLRTWFVEAFQRDRGVGD